MPKIYLILTKKSKKAPSTTIVENNVNTILTKKEKQTEIPEIPNLLILKATMVLQHPLYDDLGHKSDTILVTII